jgi:hypothetical protein
MGTYGRNFDFRVPPQSENRSGRFAAPATGVIPIGAPVIADVTAGTDSLGLQTVKLAPAGQDPVTGLSGIAVFEYAPAAFAGDDPNLTTYSDKDTVPLGKALQVVNGTYVKVVFSNTVHRSFLGQRDYAGRIMIAGLGATPTLIVGDYLEPGVGNDASGYWREVSGASGAWLVVTSVDSVRQEVEARMLF